MARYQDLVRDLLFLLLALAFFALAFAWVKACELILGSRSAGEGERGL